jgi:hypothetical protein
MDLMVRVGRLSQRKGTVMSDDVLKDLYNACNPVVPATAEYYMDCSAVRGSNALTRQFQGELSKTTEPLFFLFSGHIGSGKSSELEHLRHTLEQPSASTSFKRYFPILLDAGEYLDEYDVTPTDILLAIVAEVSAALKEKEGIELKDSYFIRRFNEIKEFFLSDAEIKAEAELTLWGVKVGVQRLKKDPDARRKVRERLIPKMTSILTEISTVFEEARLKLAQKTNAQGVQRYADIVLIMDNLEKIQRIDGRNEGEESQRELFIERAPQLMGLGAHIVYTIPLRLVRSHGPQLERIYGTSPFVLPMIKVKERDGQTPYEAGRQSLRDLLQKRARDVPLDRIFAPDALDWLITYCGGHVRDLMGFVRRACNEVNGLPIDLRAAKRALKPTVALYSTSIPASYWPKLARLERSPDLRWTPLSRPKNGDPSLLSHQTLVALIPR